MYVFVLYCRYLKLWLFGWIMILNIDRSVWYNLWSMCDFFCCYVNILWVVWRWKYWLKIIICVKIFLLKLWNIICLVMNSGYLYSYWEFVLGYWLDCLKWCMLLEVRCLRLYEGKKVSRSLFYVDLVYWEFFIFLYVYKEYYLLLCKWSFSYLMFFFLFLF